MIRLHNLAEHGHTPGLIGRCTALMARFYHEKFGLGAAFETATARDLARFVEAFDAGRDALWWVQRDDEIVGSLGLDGQGGVPGQAQLRWFFLGATTRGQGLGHRLLERAIGFARRAGHHTLTLSTHTDLAAAVHLYETHGFERQGHSQGVHWGRPLTLTHFALPLVPRPASPTGGVRTRSAVPAVPVRAGTASFALPAA